MQRDDVPLPVTVITGFLGSGKTTLLNHLLRQPKLGRIAVVVNELGEIGLDDLLVTSAQEETVLLSDGCVCCAVRSDLVDAMVGLHDRRRNGILPPFERVIVETTGLANPAPILGTVMGRPELVTRYFLDGLVSTVDALEGSSQLSAHAESVTQVALADRLIITKTDMASPDAVSVLVSKLRGINPRAPLYRAVNGEIDPARILDVGLYEAGCGGARLERWLGETDAGAAGSRVPVRHASDVATFCLCREQPLSRALVGMWLSELVLKFGAALLRAKGIVNVAGAGGPMVIHAVQSRFYPPVVLRDWPSDDHRTRIVFIVRGVGRAELEASLDAAIRRFPAHPAGVERG